MPVLTSILALFQIHFVDVKTKRVLFSQELFKYDGSKRAFVALDLAWDEDYTTSTEVSRSGSGELGDDDGDTATDSESSASHCGGCTGLITCVDWCDHCNRRIISSCNQINEDSFDIFD